MKKISVLTIAILASLLLFNKNLAVAVDPICNNPSLLTQEQTLQCLGQEMDELNDAVHGWVAYETLKNMTPVERERYLKLLEGLGVPQKIIQQNKKIAEELNQSDATKK